MTSNFAQRAGYYAGYNHGLAGNRYNPAPDLVGSLTHDTYLKIYLEHYDKGFQQGKSDQELVLRSKDLLQTRNRVRETDERVR